MAGELLEKEKKGLFLDQDFLAGKGKERVLSYRVPLLPMEERVK